MCRALGLTVRTVQRWHHKGLEDQRRGPLVHPKKIDTSERDQILKTLNSHEYCNYSPHKVHAMLADRETYLCSISTMYRLLRSENLLAHRGRGKAPERGKTIETKATAPNQVWCWDITNLPSLVRGSHFKMYLFEDLFSRKIVGHYVTTDERGEIAKSLFNKTLKSEEITGEGLRLHSDNGHPMRAYCFLDRLQALGVIPSWIRPKRSNDNPHPESLFKTMKYHPEYPYRPFRDLDEARRWVDNFVRWYNQENLHSSLGYVTPAQCHLGLDIEILKKRNQTLQLAYLKNPLRWSKGPMQWKRPVTVELNKNGCRILE